MNTKNWAFLAASLCTVVAVLGGAAVMKGGIYITRHEGDAFHLMQIVFRMADGQTPHVDLMTPIGVLAFWPIAMLVKAGAGIGMAVIWSQVLIALVFLPMVVWVAGTRLRPWLAGFFGLIVMVLLLALVHGEAQRAVSISMHYNRLAWAAAFVAILGAMIAPVRPTNSTVDGVIIGAMVCVMALVKMTYFASFAAPILISLVMTGQRRAAWVAVITGGVVIAVVTLIAGPEFWLAYAQDLLTVARSELRAAPGESLTSVIGAPAYLAGSIAAIVGVIFLRQTGVATGGVLLLLLLPGFFYVTYQNYGNDPQWLLLLGILLIALRTDAVEVINRWGWNLRDALGVVAVIALALGAPSFLNLASSPFQNLFADVDEYAPILPRGGVHTDLQSSILRSNLVDARVALDGQVAGLERYSGREEPLRFLDLAIPNCSVETGLPRYIDTIVRDLESAGFTTGKSLFAADLFSSHWLFGDLEPLDQGAPWYYGGAPGLENADYLLVPLCPIVQDVQSQILESVGGLIENGEVILREVRRTGLYVLYALD